MDIHQRVKEGGSVTDQVAWAKVQLQKVNHRCTGEWGIVTTTQRLAFLFRKDRECEPFHCHACEF